MHTSGTAGTLCDIIYSVLEGNMKDFISFLKLPPSILSALVLASGFIIFAPSKLLERMYFVDFKETYGFYIGLVFIVSISILFVYLIIKPIKYFLDKRSDKRVREGQLKFLRELSFDEKQLLREMIALPDYTMVLPVNNGVTVKLENFYVLTPAGANHLVDAYDMRVPYFVQPWVIKMARENPDIGI